MVGRDEESGPYVDSRVRMQTRIRMDKSLYEMLEKSAQESGRSMNSEIVRRLEESFERSSKVELLKKALDKADERFDTVMNILASMGRTVQMLKEPMRKNEGIRLDMPPRSREEDE